MIDPGDAAQILGWASLSPYRSASGYRFNLEASVYVSRAAHRRGIGRRLVATLDDVARTRGVHAVVASIDTENASEHRAVRAVRLCRPGLRVPKKEP